MVIAIRSVCQRIRKKWTLPSVIVFFDPTSESSYEPDSGDFVKKTPDCRKISKIFDDIENILGKLLDIAELTSVVVDSDNDQKNFEEAARGQREGGDEVKPSL